MARTGIIIDSMALFTPLGGRDLIKYRPRELGHTLMGLRLRPRPGAGAFPGGRTNPAPGSDHQASAQRPVTTLHGSLLRPDQRAGGAPPIKIHPASTRKGMPLRAWPFRPRRNECIGDTLAADPWDLVVRHDFLPTPAFTYI